MVFTVAPGGTSAEVAAALLNMMRRFDALALRIDEPMAVKGVGCRAFGELWDRSTEDMVVEAVRHAHTGGN